MYPKSWKTLLHCAALVAYYLPTLLHCILWIVRSHGVYDGRAGRVRWFNNWSLKDSGHNVKFYILSLFGKVKRYRKGEASSAFCLSRSFSHREKIYTSLFVSLVGCCWKWLSGHRFRYWGRGWPKRPGRCPQDDHACPAARQRQGLWVLYWWQSMR